MQATQIFEKNFEHIKLSIKFFVMHKCLEQWSCTVT